MQEMSLMKSPVLQAKRGTVSHILLCKDSRLQVRVSLIRRNIQLGHTNGDGLCHRPEVEVISLVWTGHRVIWPHDSCL